MAEWYYALGNQQKGPVSLDVLRQLAASGKLQRTDMVWRDGMIEWKKASQVDGIFSRAEAAPARRRSEPNEDEPLRRRSHAVEVVDDDDVDVDRPRRKKRRRKERSPGAMAAIIGSSVGGGILILVVVIVLLLRSGRGGAANDGRPAALDGGNSYTLTLRPGQNNTRTFTFQQGKRIEVLVRSPQGWFRNPDVDLFITRVGDQQFELMDIDVSENCYLQFVAPATDQYMIDVENLGPGTATSTISIRET